MINGKIFREYDIRGIAGEDITPETAVLIGKAFGTFVRRLNPDAKKTSVGRDVRLSSEYLADALMRGITSAGLDVYDIGVCPTPLQYFSLFLLGLDGGVMVTGSHNPPEYNGFKISRGKETIYGGDIQEMKAIIQEQGWITSAAPGKIERYDICPAYERRMLDEFSYLRDLRFKKLKLVIDAGNGTAGIIVPKILNSIGCEAVPLYCEPDGTFPNHHPDPTVVEYMEDLIARVREADADLGFGYDGDADRIGVVNRDGDIVWGDQMMIALSREILRNNPGARIIGDVKCSQAMFDDIKAHGGMPVMCKTGHSLVKDRMKKEGALLAGEFSGHIFIADRYFGYDDAIYTTLRLVEIMKTSNMDMKQLLSGIPEMFYTPEIRIECPDDSKKRVVQNITAQFLAYKEASNAPCRVMDVNMLDGVRVAFEKGWGLIRASNTQPAIVMRVEAENTECLSLYKAIMEEEVRKAMGRGE